MYAFHKFGGVCAALLLCLGLQAHAAPLLNGVSAHQELGREIFIGALYSETLSTNADSLLNSSLPMRMELKIVASDGIMRRRFSRLWIEGMAVNNRADVLTAQADNVVSFDALFKDNLTTNDHVIFEKIPNTGVRIQINGVVLGVIEDTSFFSLLLSTWIGRVPLSSEYREALLMAGQVDDPLRTRFAAINPTPARIADINLWLPTTAETAPQAQSSAANSSAARQVIAVEAPVIEKPKLTLPVQPAPTVATPTAAADDDTEEESLTAQSLLSRQFYISDLLRKINGNTSYPRRAQERGQEGNIRLAVIIDRQGKVLSLHPLAESPHNLLNREARDAVNRSAPFPALPDSIQGNRFEFTVPIRFVLPKQS